jgi:hypothetical protein
MSLVATCSAEPGCWDCSSSVDATNRSSGNRHIEPIGQILRPWLDVLELGDDVTRDKDPFAHIAMIRMPLSLRSARFAASRTISVRPGA